MNRTIRIDPRFNGPPTSGNGGYVCGEIARSIEGPARVRLYVPPPLETPLVLEERDGEGVGLYDGEALIGEGWPAELELDPPPCPSFDEATRASRAYRGFNDHPLPDCFVCGPNREAGDGLQLFPGALEDGHTFATPWIPDDSLVSPSWEGEGLDPIFLWSALDCPGCFAFPQPEGALCLLGELTTRIDGPIAHRDRCVVVSWSIGDEGRKHTTGTALYDGAGICRGMARSVWIEVPLPNA